MDLTLGYWGLRGLAEPIRFLLHYKGKDFVDKRYVIGENEWKNEKFQLGLDFPNLPYLIDGDLKLTQSTTILRHLAKKYDLAGKNEEERRRVELVEQQIVDLRMNLILTCIKPNYEEVKPEFLKTVPAQLKLYADFLGDRKYLAGDSVTYVDFIAYETFDFYRLFSPGVLVDFPNLAEYHSRIKNLPELQNYLKSPTYTRWPIFGPAAHFGGKGDAPEEE